jgi:hypothetical protein
MPRAPAGDLLLEVQADAAAAVVPPSWDLDIFLPGA